MLVNFGFIAGIVTLDRLLFGGYVRTVTTRKEGTGGQLPSIPVVAKRARLGYGEIKLFC